MAITSVITRVGAPGVPPVVRQFRSPGDIPQDEVPQLPGPSGAAGSMRSADRPSPGLKGCSQELITDPLREMVMGSDTESPEPRAESGVVSRTAPAGMS